MTTQIFATLNQNALGPGLVLDQGGLVVTTNAAALSNARKALGTLPKGVGESLFECTFYSDSRTTPVPAGIRVGLAQTSSLTNIGTGVDALSYGLDLNTGNLYSNTAVLANVVSGGIPERTVISTYTKFNVSSITMHFFTNGVWRNSWTVSSVSGKFWVPSVTVCGGNAADWKAFLGFGQRGLKYPRLVIPS